MRYRGIPTRAARSIRAGITAARSDFALRVVPLVPRPIDSDPLALRAWHETFRSLVLRELEASLGRVENILKKAALNLDIKDGRGEAE